jgi:hypothetical protein
VNTEPTTDPTIEPVTGSLVELHGIAVLDYAPDSPVLRTEQDALDVLGDAFGVHAELVVVPVSRLAQEFFTLDSGLAGAIIQKFVTYHRRLVILGDIAGQLAGSSALRAFVYESNRGNHVWFLADRDELDQRLRPAAEPD